MPCSDIKCCCGRDDCAYLQHNTTALEGLEKDVETAARLGQALLDRHESYMTEAEKDRTTMLSEVDKLEKNKQEVLAENARIIEDNRNLVDQLEDLNHAISESDAFIKSLTTTLESTQLEVRRLMVAASRATQLETQLSELESEQSRLQDQLANSEENEKSAVQRWKKAECTLRDLHDQLDTMEKESKEERERHADLIAQMDRKKMEEKGAGSSGVDRLKVAGRATSLGRQKNGTNVVSNFVGDILQDNANLQMSIVELREMLQNSDEEIQGLREQVMLHQPLGQKPDETPNRRNLLPLSEELRSDSPAPLSQELHVHHHFHGASPSPHSKRDKPHSHIHRRHRKRRPAFPPTLLESPSREPVTSKRVVSHTPRDSTSSASTMFSQASQSVPSVSGFSHRWSSSTTGQVLSSSPSSPQSAYQPASIFDRFDRGFDSSRPTSPESVGFASPTPKGYVQRQADASFHSIFEADEMGEIPGEAHANHHVSPLDITETEAEPVQAHPVSEQPGAHTPTRNRPIGLQYQDSSKHDDTSDRIKSQTPNQISSSMPTGNNIRSPSPMNYRSVNRTASRESLTSSPAMDIHSAVSRPKRYHQSSFPSFAKPPSRISSAGTIFSSVAPVISRTNITIPKIAVNSEGSDDKSSVSLLTSVVSTATISQSNSPTSSVPASIHESTSPSPSPTKPRGIGKRVGGWVLGRWNNSPTPSTRDAPSSLGSDTGDGSSLHISDTLSVQTTLASSAPIISRAPGVNQKGPILGIRPPPKAPSSVQPTELNQELLQESLQE